LDGCQKGGASVVVVNFAKLAGGMKANAPEWVGVESLLQELNTVFVGLF
jgi:hypothetical protein